MSDRGTKSKTITEETPLLLTDEDEELGDGTSPPNCDEPPLFVVWDGFRDFEGLPWYKQPSVGTRLKR